MASFETFTRFASEADFLFSCQNISGTGESEWVWCCYGLLWTLYCHKHRYCDVAMKWPLLFHGMRADVSEAPNNTLTTRMHGDYRSSIDRFFVGFNAICYAFLRNNLIYIEGRNCSFSAVPVLLNKSSGLRPSDTLSSCWLGWRRHVRVGKLLFGESSDSYFQSFTIVLLTIYLYCIKGILRGYAIR